MNTLADVKAKVQSLLGDPDGDWVTDEYVTPLINQTYGDQYLRIRNACGQNLEGVVLVANVAAGTTSLYQYQRAGQPLCGLYTPDHVWTKPAGTPANYFRRGHGPHQLPPASPPGATPVMLNAVVAWDWLGNKLLVTPSAAALDFEVRGRFTPPELTADEDELIVDPSMWVATSYGAAALAAVERANPQILEGYAMRADATCDNIAAELVRQTQDNPARTGRMDRNASGYYGYRWQ